MLYLGLILLYLGPHENFNVLSLREEEEERRRLIKGEFQFIVIFSW